MQTGVSTIFTTTGHLRTEGNDAVDILMADHRAVRTLLEELCVAEQANPNGYRAALEMLKASLTIHNATEETVVYPALALAAGKRTEAGKLYHETAEADLLIFALDHTLKRGDMSEFALQANRLRDAILEHVEDEEKAAFPHLRNRLEPSDMSELTAAVRHFRSAIAIDVPR